MTKAQITNLRDRKIGYVRVSTNEQHVDLQVNALKSYGCEVIYTDHGISGKARDRPGLNELLQSLQPGDILVVWRLDRLGRSLSHLVELIESLGRQQIQFTSLTENIDTSSSTGRLIFHMIAALAEFERSLISERTRAGINAARLRGKTLGRPTAISGEHAYQLYLDYSRSNTPIDLLAKQ